MVGAVTAHARSDSPRRLVALVLLAGVGVTVGAACGPDDTAVVPDECAAGGPFSERACGRVLAAICERHGEQTACEGAPSWDLGDSFPVRCAWADVVSFDEPDSCAGARATGRCVASVYVGEGGPACVAACRGEDGLEGLGWQASRRGDELVHVRDPGGGCWGGPIDATSHVETSPEEKTYGDCGADIPPPPSLCACGAQACAAL